MSNYEEIMAKLGKKTRDRVLAASEVVVEKIPTASISLNQKLGGGFGKGRQSTIWGNKSAGKTTLLLQTAGLVQKSGGTVAWIDAENSFDPEWATRLGVNVDEVILSRAKSIDNVTAIGTDLLTAGVDFMVTDSISSLIPSTYFEKNEDFKEGLEGTRQIGTMSKELGVMINKFNFANTNTALVMVSQLRKKMNMYGASNDLQGGEAMKFFSSTIVKLWSSASEKEQIMQEFERGGKTIQRPVGRKVGFTIEFNKIGPPNQTGEYDLFYDGEEVGVDNIGEVLDLAVDNNLIVRGSTGWYTIGDEKIQGRPRAVEYLRDNVTIYEELENKLLNG